MEHHERQAKQGHQPHEQHRHPEADDRAEGKPRITGMSQQRGSSGAGGSSREDQQVRQGPAAPGEDPTQWAALQEPLLQPDDGEHQGMSHEHGPGPMQQRSAGGGSSSGITGVVRHALSSGRDTVKGIVERVEKVGRLGHGWSGRMLHGRLLRLAVQLQLWTQAHGLRALGWFLLMLVPGAPGESSCYFAPRGKSNGLQNKKAKTKVQTLWLSALVSKA